MVISSVIRTTTSSIRDDKGVEASSTTSSSTDMVILNHQLAHSYNDRCQPNATLRWVIAVVAFSYEWPHLKQSHRGLWDG